MNKSEYIDAIAKMTGYSKAQTADFLNASITVVTKALKKNDSVQVTGSVHGLLQNVLLAQVVTLLQVKL